MPNVRFDKRFVAKVRASARTSFFDVKVTGLTLRVSPSGAKSWHFVYRVAGKPSQWLHLGSYPALSLAAARDLALTHRRDVDVSRKDPAAERRTAPPTRAPSPFTVADFAPVFVLFQKGRGVKTWQDDHNKIGRYILPAWGTLPLRDVTRRHVHELLDAAAGQGLTVGVNRLQAVISRMFTVALDRGLIDAHPAARMIKRFAETASTRTLADDELRALWRGLAAHPGAAAEAIRLRLLLGQRGQETAGLLWSEVDLEAGIWSLPADRTKNKRAHVVPLSPTALALLTRRHKARAQDEARVFPDLALSGDAHKALATIHGGAYEWKDLRRTVATRLASLGFDETTIGRTLNHARVSVTAKHYNQHEYVEEIRRALTAWDDELRRILTNKTKARPRVVPMRGRPRR